MQGIYVLQDNQFRPVTRISSWEGRAEAIRLAKIVRADTVISVPPFTILQYVMMPAGVIKGALSRLGYNGTVTPEITSLPQCTPPHGIILYHISSVCRYISSQITQKYMTPCICPPTIHSSRAITFVGTPNSPTSSNPLSPSILRSKTNESPLSTTSDYTLP